MYTAIELSRPQISHNTVRDDWCNLVKFLLRFMADDLQTFSAYVKRYNCLRFHIQIRPENLRKKTSNLFVADVRNQKTISQDILFVLFSIAGLIKIFCPS